MPDSNLGGQVTDHILLLLELYEYLTQFKSLKLGFMKGWQQTICWLCHRSGSYSYRFAFICESLCDGCIFVHFLPVNKLK